MTVQSFNFRNYHNVFHRIDRDKECIMFDDAHVLNMIIDAFLPYNQVSQMGGFEEAVDSFKSSAKMGHLEGVGTIIILMGLTDDTLEAIQSESSTSNRLLKWVTWKVLGL